MGRITLDEDQLEAVRVMVAEPTRAALNASQYGTGKTVVTIEAAEQIGLGIRLIVCPLFTKYSWEATILGQYPDAVVKHINSRKAGQAALADLVAGRAGWYLVGREYFISKSVKDTFLKAVNTHKPFFAYDECARWSNYKSQGYKHIRKLRPGYFMALSATPAGDRFTGLFAITHALWPKLEGHDSYWQFVKDHCETAFDPFAGLVATGEKDPGHYVKSLPCYVRLEKDFGTPIEAQIIVKLSSAERKIYDQFEKYLIAWIGENPLVAQVPIVKRTRLRQMTLGEISMDITEDGEQHVYFDKDMKSTKYDTLVDVLKEYNEPAIIFTDSAKYADVVAYKLIQDGFKALPWTGEVTEDVRHAMKEAFEAGEIDYIVATIASIGEGVDGLQHRARLMIWLSRSDWNMINQQAFRRLYRRGQTKQVVSLDIVAEDTYDDGQLSKLIQNALDMNKSLKDEQ